MTRARKINEKLDIILLQRRMGTPESSGLGASQAREELIKKRDQLKQEVFTKLYKELNVLTNNGTNCKNIFTNDYYVNDMTQDALCQEEST